MMQFAIMVLAAVTITMTSAHPTLNLGRIYVSELFSKKIEPQLFNWTIGQPEQFKFRASLKGHPDLPGWMNYMYSSEYYAGYLYGTPPSYKAGDEEST